MSPAQMLAHRLATSHDTTSSCCVLVIHVNSFNLARRAFSSSSMTLSGDLNDCSSMTARRCWHERASCAACRDPRCACTSHRARPHMCWRPASHLKVHVTTGSMAKSRLVHRSRCVTHCALPAGSGQSGQLQQGLFASIPKQLPVLHLSGSGQACVDSWAAFDKGSSAPTACAVAGARSSAGHSLQQL